MPSFTTLFRAATMLATAVLVVRGWQLYGPTTDQMKSFTGRAIEIAHEVWNGSQQRAGANGSLTADPHVIATPFASSGQPALPSDASGGVRSDAQVAPAFHAPVAPPIFAQSAVEEPTPATSDKLTAIQNAAGDRFPALLARLQELGGTEPQLVEWGHSGQLYRFSCRAALDDLPNFARHFESVAAEPLVAVEEVLAKVEAWRSAQRDEGLRR